MPTPTPDDRDDRERQLATDVGRYAGRETSIGIQFGLTIALLALGGYWLDRRIGTLPLFLIVGVLVGFVGGFISILKKVPPARGSSGPKRPAGPDEPPTHSSP